MCEGGRDILSGMGLRVGGSILSQPVNPLRERETVHSSELKEEYSPDS